MIKIYWVRHVEYSNPRNIIPGRLPVEISETGFNQAHNLRRYFENKPIKKIYSSMVLRAKQTAEIISASRIPIQYDGRLLETLTVFQGFPKDEWNKYGGFHEGLGGETPLEIQKRIVNFFEKNNWENGHEYIVVSHGDPSYFLYKYLKKQPIEEKEYTQNLGKYGTFSHESEYQKKGSIRIISKENKEWVVGEYLQNNELINN